MVRTKRTRAATTEGRDVKVLEDEKQKEKVAEMRRWAKEESEAPVPAEGGSGGGAKDRGHVGSESPRPLAHPVQPRDCPSPQRTHRKLEFYSEERLNQGNRYSGRDEAL